MLYKAKYVTKIAFFTSNLVKLMSEDVVKMKSCFTFLKIANYRN
ncbi:hypothetical protein AJ90_21295 [Vibrio parahaemolyticus M0605]|nr:hypothetical protein AJ90_21295 [Vibrio parahaemolyticus M0605]